MRCTVDRIRSKSLLNLGLEESMVDTHQQRAAARSEGWVANLTIGLLVGGVGAVHLLLLWERIVSLTLFEPMVAARWLAAIALLVVLRFASKRGWAPFWGRRALIFWMPVLLLHGGVMGPAGVDRLAEALDTPSRSLNTPLEGPPKGPLGGPSLLWSLPALGVLVAAAGAARAGSRTRLRHQPKICLGSLGSVGPLRVARRPVLGIFPSLASRPPPR